MTGTNWNGGCAVIETVPMMLPGAMSSLFMIASDGSCPALNVSCWLPPAAPMPAQDRRAVRRPMAGVSNGPGGPVGTPGEDPAPCHAARAAPSLNGRPNGPLAVRATARDPMVRLALGAGRAGLYSGRTKVRLRLSSRIG